VGYAAESIDRLGLGAFLNNENKILQNHILFRQKT
jgi:hypothetical protein